MFVLAILLFSHLSWAVDSCSTIDLSKGLGPGYDQKGTWWCHAFTTTDCLTKHLLNKGTLKSGERLHPLQIAAALPLADDRSVVNSIRETSTMATDMETLTAGTQHQTPKGALTFTDGLCTESDLADQKDRALALFNSDWETANRSFNYQTCEPKVENCSFHKDAVRNLRPLCDQVIDDEAHYWSNLFNSRCHRAWPDWHVETLYFKNRYAKILNNQTLKPESAADDNQAERRIDKALESGELAAIGYDVSFIHLKHQNQPESHWSSVVGRHRAENGSCVYTIRNSWGPSCEFYDRSIANCKEGQGYLEIPASLLVPRIHSIQYFDEPPPTAIPATPPAPMIDPNGGTSA